MIVSWATVIVYFFGSPFIVTERPSKRNNSSPAWRMAPVAGVVGLGLNLADPDGLLKGNGEEGFSVALLE